MKIHHSFNRASELTGTLKKDDKKVKDSKEASFKARYNKIQDETAQERVNRLMNQINEQGKALSKKVDVRELKVYKQLISEFLYEMVNNTHIFLKENKLDRRGRHRVWASVKQINEELEELTKEVLKEEKDNLKILKHMEDIRGLLLDIVM